MANIGDLGSLPAKLTQNTLDFWAKQLQEYIDAYFGSETDNNSEFINIPFTFDGYVYFTTQSFIGGKGNYSGYIHTVIPLTEVEDYFVEFYPTATFDDPSYAPYLVAYADGCHLRKNDGFIGYPIYMERSGGTNMLYTVTDGNDGGYADQIFTYDYVYRDPNIGNSMPTLSERHLTQICFDNNGTGLLFTKAALSYRRLNLKPVNAYSVITGGGTSDFNSTINNNYNTNSTYHNTYTYTTENGDEMTVYYGDNYINYDYNGTDLTYDDFYDITNHIIDDLSVNLGDEWNGDNTPVHFPSYDDVKYGDMGDFYITPLHQYDKIQPAPSFDGTIDLGDYPTVFAEGATTFLNFMPATLSALFTAAFVACVVLKKLGR